MTTSTHADSTTDISESGKELRSYLTGKGATIQYGFVDMSVEVPKSTGADLQRATRKLNGTVRIRTTDNDDSGSLGSA